MWADKARTFAHFAEEVFDHLLRNLEIGDHTIAQRPDRLDLGRRAPQHLLGFLANREHLLSAIRSADGDHRGLVEDDPATLQVDKRVYRAEVDRHVTAEQTEHSLTNWD